MIIISDTSPIRALFVVEHLFILPALFGDVIIPQAVADELVSLEKLNINFKLEEHKQWIKIVSVSSVQSLKTLLEELDKGEAEAIALAQELHADLLLIDEFKGRRIALQRGLNIIGVLGILLEAKRKNIIPSLKNLIDDLDTKGKFRMHPELIARVLKEANEV